MAEKILTQNPSRRKPPSIERLKEILHYDPSTGLFRHRIDRQGGAKAGALAGTDMGKGYFALSIDGQQYYAHRLAWFYVHGTFPEKEIDHINRNPSDNRIANLRPASIAQNKWNMRKHVDNSRLKGTHFHKTTGRYSASIMKDRRLYYLGIFSTAEEAHAAYCKKAVELFGEFARTS